MTGVADLATVPDHGVAEPDPLLPRNERHQVALDLVGVGLVAKTHALGQATDVGIDRDALWGIELTRLSAEASQHHHGTTALIEGLNTVIAGIRHIQQVIRPPGQPFWAQQAPTLRPLYAESLEEATIRCEDLNAVILGIGDVQSTSLVDHHAAGLPELSALPPFLPDGDGSSIRAGFNRRQQEIRGQEDGGKQATEERHETSTTDASHGLIHHHEQCEA